MNNLHQLTTPSSMKLTITSYSTALFATWYFIEELGLLFDAGDGLISSLLQKSRKIEHVFISHADRDHLTGLFQLNQLNARDGFPKVFYPSDSSSFRRMEEFSKQFDPQVKRTIWTPIKGDEHIPIRKDMFVQAIRNNHVQAEQSVIKSLGFQVYQTKTKLKPEFLGLPEPQLIQLMRERGKETMMQIVEDKILAYSGDTPVENCEQWNNTNILIHEATFLEGEGPINLDTHRNKHSTLEEVLKMVSEINIDTLILGHFSSRYSADQIDETIKRLCKVFRIKIPVYRVLPGQIHRNILDEPPIYSA
ncbi:MBL fold metallo-hydrolase [Spirosoma koreense]